ncbi:MAG: LuxR C-terminal-related transcriptional regulator [Candidatus Binatia bacterium]
MADDPRVRADTAARRVSTRGIPVHEFHGKLRPPEYRARILARDALLARLRGAGARVTLILAPAGFGKTTLLAQWHADARRRGACAAWVGLDAGDRDGERFLAVVREAFAHAGAVLRPPPPLPRAATWQDLEARAHALCSELIAAPVPLLLLDDYHEAESSEVDRLVDLLVTHGPPALRVAIATRRRPALPLTTWLARGLLAPLDAGLLNFTATELRRLFDGRLDDAALARVMAHTEGWSIAVQMILVLLAQEPHQDVLARLLSDPGVGLGHYLAEQIYDRLPAPCRAFLRETAVLDRISAPLADAVRARDDSAALLQSLAGIEPLLTPVGDERPRWYRHHALFRDFLALLLQDTSPPGAIRVLHARAARWFAAHGALRDALRHACAADDRGLAATLFAEAGGATIGLTAGVRVLRELLASLPATWLHGCAEFELAHCLLLAKEGRVVDACTQFAQTRRLPTVVTAPHLQRDLVFIETILSIYTDDGATPEAVADTERALAALPGADAWFRGWLYNRLLLLQYRRGALTAARVAATRALDSYREAAAPYTEFFVHLHTGFIELARGRIADCYRACRRARSLATARFGDDRSLRALADVLRAEVLYERNKCGFAARLLDAALPEVEHDEGWTEIFLSGYRTLGRLLRARGQSARATDVPARAELTAATRHLPRLRLWALIERIELATLAGDLGTARELAGTDAFRALHAPEPRDRGTWWERQRARLAAARLALADGDPAAALAWLAASPACEADARPFFVIERQLIVCQAAVAGGDPAAAAAALAEVHALVLRHGVPRSAAPDPDAPLAAIMTLAALGADAGICADIARALRRLLAAGGTRGAMAGRLSAREQEILRHLARGSPNKAIARALSLSERTVKFHLQNIYAKLGVHSRTEALAAVLQPGREP